MNADDLNKLPRYIEAPGGGMWLLPKEILDDNETVRYVKLSDVKKLLEETECPYCGMNIL